MRQHIAIAFILLSCCCWFFGFFFCVCAMKQLSGYGNVNTQTNALHPSTHTGKTIKRRQQPPSAISMATLGLTVSLARHSLTLLLTLTVLSPHSRHFTHYTLPLCNALALARTHATVNESTATTTAQVTPLRRGLSSLKRR